MSPADILAKALSSHDDYALGTLARALDIPAVAVRRAAHGAAGQPTRADYHFKLCAWLGVDPLTGFAAPAARRVDLDASLFAMGVKMARFGKGHAIGAAAKAIGISQSVLSRIENGEPRSLEAMIAVCRYAGLDPKFYVTVSRETPTENRPSIAA